MTATELADRVLATLVEDRSQFRSLVREEADALAEEVAAGTFNNPVDARTTGVIWKDPPR